MSDLDHVILGVSDLAHGNRKFEALTGIAPQFGGVHPGRGTQNSLVSLGDGRYLEMLAPTDAHVAPADPRVAHRDPTFAGWALQTRDLEALIGRLRAAGIDASDPLPGGREAPDGRVLRWRTAVPNRAARELGLFFIEWSADTVHPSASAPGGCSLHALTIGHPDPDWLRTFFGVVGFDVALQTAPSPRLSLVLDCPKGRVAFAGA